MSRTWFIIGSSRGFGRSLALAALRSGDHVAANQPTLRVPARSEPEHDDRELALGASVTVGLSGFMAGAVASAGASPAHVRVRKAFGDE